MNNTISSNYKAAMQIFKDKKWTLCGLIILEAILSLLAEIFGVLPIVSLPLCFAISVSSAAICLKGVRGESVDSKNLFDGFKNFKHNVGGMAWMSLWVYIWVIVPIIVLFNVAMSGLSDEISAEISFGMGIRYSTGSGFSAGDIVMICIAVLAFLVGFVIMIIKMFTYCFTPYILTDKPEIHTMDAIKESKKLTAGIRGKIFWANVIPALILLLVDIVLAVFAKIPFIGVLFDIIMSILNIAATVFMSVFLSLTLASFYNKATAPVAAPAAAVIENPAPAAPEAPVASAPVTPVAPAPAAPETPAPVAPAAPEAPAPAADDTPKAE